MNTMQYITITKSSLTGNYICHQPMNYDFYLLYLLWTEKLRSTNLDELATREKPLSHYKTQKNYGLEFYKNSSTKCFITLQLCIHKNNGYIELFAHHDLIHSQDLCLPKSPKFIMTSKNFINFLVQKQELEKLSPAQLFIVIDQHGHAQLTTNLETLTKISLLALMHKKIMGLLYKK